MSLHPVPRVAVIVVAAGSGTRLGADDPKAFVGIDQHSILRHALRGVFSALDAQVVIVVPAGREGDARSDAVAEAGDRADFVTVVTGGTTRADSVLAGLSAVWADVDTVLVHDAARALTPAEVFERVVRRVTESGQAVVPALPVVDTLKRVDGVDVVGGVDRAVLAAAQTPQGFPRAMLAAASAEAGEFTDDAARAAAAGFDVVTVPGDALAFKITTPADLDRARHLVRRQSAAAGSPAPSSGAPFGVGVGTDVHAFGGSGALWLAGLEWEGEPGLAGHSDGDAVAHAVVDALLAAAGLGDIGTLFGTADPAFAGAHADAFLSRTRVLLAEAGWRIGNVSVQVQAQRPRFAPRRAEAEGVLSAALGGAAVSVSATTTDGLGFTGRGEGVAATAVALVYRA